MDNNVDEFKGFIEEHKPELSDGIDNIIVDFNELKTYNERLAVGVLDEPDIFIPDFKKATRKYSKNEVDVLVKNVPRKVLLRGLSSEYLGKMISLSGIICRVVPTRPMIRTAAFKCRKCGDVKYIPQNEPFLVRPDKCGTGRGSCKSRQFRLLEDPNETTYFDVQELSIQDKPEDLKASQAPQLVSLEITKKALINKVRAGDVVDVVGVLRTKPPSATTKKRKWSLFVDVFYITSVNKDPSDVYISPEEEQELRWLASDDGIYEKISLSIAPSIFGCETIKEAIMYQLFGGREKRYPDRTVRGTIHVLWIDDPSKAKSQILVATKNLAPRGLYVTGGGASAAGLTAAVVKVDKDLWALEAGAVVLANDGICCIDEIEKMSNDDRKRIHEAMAQGTVNIQKATAHYQLPAKTSILAAGNPTLGRYDSYQTLKENISLPPTILSRFDLIFIGKDSPDEDKDGRLAEHILRGPETYEVEISKDILRKYIALAKRIDPELTDKAKTHLIGFYKKMRIADGRTEDSPISITPRQLDALVRLSESHARIRLSEIVEEKDAVAAIDIMLKSLRQVGIDPETGEYDVDNIMTGMPKTVRDRKRVIMNLLADMDSHPEEELIEILTSKGISRDIATKIITQMLSDRSIFSPSTGYYRRVV